MNILILGGGGREHGLARQLKKSPECTHLYVAPGNAGTAQIAENLKFKEDQFKAIKAAVLKYHIQMLVVGPEKPLVLGIYDFFQDDSDLQHVQVIGPSREGALLEGSKERAKEFMTAHNIPTAQYKTFTAKELEAGKAFLESLTPPYVLKADGLAGGKGVLIPDNLKDAKIKLENMLLQQQFGEASETVVIEEFLQGTELSVFALTDGKHYKILPTAKDYKRVGEGDTGLNTGGMGAVSPAVFADDAFMEKVENRVVKPTIEGLQQENITYKGIIFFGLMNVHGDPYVIEYNVRMGDPETEVVLPRIKSDLVSIFDHLSKGNLNESRLVIDERHTATIMLVSGGYPQAYKKGKKITGLDQMEDCLIFHAGTRMENKISLTNGGRVLAITAFGKTYKQALAKAYREVHKIYFDKMYYRTDLGKDLDVLN